MKKLFLGLCFFSAVLTASASNEVVVLPAKIIEMDTIKIANEKNPEDRLYTCSIEFRGMTFAGSYSCFFCWGGGYNRCLANLAKDNNIAY